MNWFNKKISPMNFNYKTNINSNVWIQCPGCYKTLLISRLKKNMMVCYLCAHHFRLNARERAHYFLDKNSSIELFYNITSQDIFKFKDIKTYTERLQLAKNATKENEALSVFKGSIKNSLAVVCIFNFYFMGGSMGSVVGEKFVLATELAIKENIPLICFTASGGARMQESFFSLMQMAKTSAAISKLYKYKILYIVVLTDPTTGGVSASLGMLGDIHIAEPKALIGFTGPRIIKETVKENLPKGFQRSEFLLERGMIDRIVYRKELRNEISSLMKKFMPQ